MTTAIQANSLPEFIGAYRILRKLGEGGVGMVLEARHQTLERGAAIKLLHCKYASSPEVLERFFNEARAAGRIDHPSIVQVFDFGKLPSGDAYLVMELLNGESLAARLKRGPLSILGALRFTWQTAEALAAAHQAGIVHRDIKPDNLMLVRDGMVMGGERVKVVDFGIAKLALVDGSTRTGTVMGTPAYMAPEQCRGVREVNDRVDVYAVGVLLFRALSGQLPFIAEDLHAYFYQHMFEPPPLLRSLVPSVSESLDQLVQRLLAKDSADRPSMQQVAAELRALLAGMEGAGSMLAPQPELSQPSAVGLAGASKEAAAATTLGNGTGHRIRAPLSGWLGLWGLVAGGCTLAGMAWLLRSFPHRVAVHWEAPAAVAGAPAVAAAPPASARPLSAEIRPAAAPSKSALPGQPGTQRVGPETGAAPKAEPRPLSPKTPQISLRQPSIDRGFLSAPRKEERRKHAYDERRNSPSRSVPAERFSPYVED